MMDLVLFSSCAILTKFISRQEHVKSTALAPSAAGRILRSPSERQTESYSSASIRAEVPSKASESSILYQSSHIIFQTTLLLSLWLFCLSILEAAPASWLLIIHETSTFVQCYRINLWALCILLEVAIPTFLGVMIVVKLSGYETLTASSTSSPAASPSKAPKSPRIHTEKGDRHKIMLLFRVIMIGIRFSMATVWYLLRRILAICLPQRSSTTNGRDRCRTSGDRCTSSSRLVGYCSPKVALPVIFALSLSFWTLGTLSTIVISDTDSTYTESESMPETQPKHKLGQYCLWVIGPHSPLKFMVKMACALGMILASLLNGFGCASLPHSNLVGMYLKPTSAAVLAKVEEDYFYAAQNLEEKKYMLSGILQLSSTANVPTNTIKVKELREEINFLENLVGDMNGDIEEMKHSQHLALKARTISGRISWVLGVVFSVILVVRVILASSSFMYVSRVARSMPGQRRDPITMIVLWLSGHDIVSEEQYNLYLQGTSLILAGFLTASQVRNFFRVIGFLSRKFGQVFGISFDATNTRGTMGELSLLLCSFTMGCYFLSCVVVVKMTLPLEYRSAFSDSIGKFDFGFNAAVLNMIFCTSTCTVAVILGFLFGIQRNNSERYNIESTLSSKGSFSQDSATHTA